MIPDLQEKLKNAEVVNDERSELEDKVADLEKEVVTLNEQLTQLNEFKIKSEALKQDKIELFKQVQKLEERLKSEMELQERFKVTLQDKEELESKLEKLETQLVNKQKKLEESLEITQLQAEKIENLEAQISSVAATQISAFKSPKQSSSTGMKYFGYVAGEFVKTSKKGEKINLELDGAKRRWILTIAPNVSLVDKNKALRIARSLPSTGLRNPGGAPLGKGFELTIIGE